MNEVDASSHSFFTILDIPFLVQIELVKYLGLNDLINLIEASPLLEDRFTPIGPFIRVWNVNINHRTLAQTNAAFKKVKTRVLSNGWQITLNVELQDIDVIADKIGTVLNGWESCIKGLSIDANGHEKFPTWYSDINLPNLKSLKITGLSHSNSRYVDHLISFYVHKLDTLKVIGCSKMGNNCDVNIQSSPRIQLKTLVLQQCRLKSALYSIKQSITCLKLYRVQLSGINRSDYYLPNLKHLIVESYNDMEDYDFVAANSSNLLSLGLFGKIKLDNKPTHELEIPNLKALMVENSDYLYLTPCCKNSLDTLVVVRGYFNPDHVINLPRLKNLILCDSLLDSTNTYSIVHNNSETLEFLAIMSTILTAHDINFNLPNLKLFLLETCNNDIVSVAKDRYPQAQVSSINWKGSEKISFLCKQYPGISNILHSSTV